MLVCLLSRLYRYCKAGQTIMTEIGNNFDFVLVDESVTKNDKQ